MFEALLLLIKKNQISFVVLSEQTLEDSSLEQLAQALKDNQSVTTVKLNYSNVGIEGMRTLLEVLEAKPFPLVVELNNHTDNAALNELQTVFVQSNRFRRLLAQIYANQISKITFTKSIYGDSDEICFEPHDSRITYDKNRDTTELKQIIEALKDNQSITHLELVKQQINTIDMQTWCEVFSKNRSIATLSIQQCQIYVGALQILIAALKVNQSLTTIVLSYNKMNDPEAQALCEALKVNQTLTTINLSCNQIGDLGAQALCEALKVNQTLITINLNKNPISAVGRQALCDVLKENHMLPRKLRCFDGSVLEEIYEQRIFEEWVTQIHANQIESITLSPRSNDRIPQLKKLQPKQWLGILKHNQSVTHLTLMQCAFDTTDAFVLNKVLKINQALTDINLEHNQIGDVGAQALSEALKVNQTLTSINLSKNKIGDVAAQALSEVLKVNQALTNINLGHNQIGDVGAQALSEALKVNQTLTSINLSKNNIGDVAAQALSEVLKVNRALTAINLENNQIGDVGAQALCDALRTNPKLIKLIVFYEKWSNQTLISENIRKNINESYQQKAFEQWLASIRTNQILEIELFPFSDAPIYPLNKSQIKQWMEIFKDNQSVTSLALIDYQFDTTEVQILSEALTTNYSLMKLTLNAYYDSCSGNYDNPFFINDSGAQALSAMLKVNQTLTHLDLYTHQIGDDGVQALCDALIINQSIIFLNLGCSESPCFGNTDSDDPPHPRGRIGNNGAQELSRMLELNQALTTLNLQYNQIDQVGVRALSKALKINRTLKTLNLSYNTVGDEGAKALSKALKINRSLTALELKWVEIQDEGAQALAEAILINSSLIHINLRDNEINADGGFPLIVSLAKNASITNFKASLYYDIWNFHSDYAEAIAGNLAVRRKQIKNTRNQTLLMIVILLRHAYALEGYRWPGSPKTLGPLPRHHLPADMWRSITHWFDFPSVERGYRTSREVSEFLMQKNIFKEFNQRLQTGESFQLVEMHSSKVGESRFGFLAPRKLPTPQPIALMENEIELEPAQARPKRERTFLEPAVADELELPQETKRLKN